MVVTSGGAQGGGERRSGRDGSGSHLTSSAIPKGRAALAAASTQFSSGAGQRRRYTAMEVLAKIWFLTEGRPHSSLGVTTDVHHGAPRKALIAPFWTISRD